MDGAETDVARDGTPRTAFTSAAGAEIVRRAATAAGLDADGAELLRLGENAVFRLRNGVFGRVARGPEALPAVLREVHVAQWLEGVAYPAGRLLPEVPQPTVIDGHPVTFWRYIEQSPVPPTYGDLGRLLRQLHSLSVPDWLDLPDIDPMGKTEARIVRAGHVSDDDRRFLVSRYEELREACEQLALRGETVPLHGDSHIKNLLRDQSGAAVFVDLETFAIGRREWDLSVIGTEYSSCHWISESQYADFVDAYGFDVTSWADFATLRDVQEFKMTTWLMQNVSESRAVAEEFHRRLSSIRHPGSERNWNPF